MHNFYAQQLFTMHHLCTDLVPCHRILRKLRIYFAFFISFSKLQQVNWENDINTIIQTKYDDKTLSTGPVHTIINKRLFFYFMRKKNYDTLTKTFKVSSFPITQRTIIIIILALYFTPQRANNTENRSNTQIGHKWIERKQCHFSNGKKNYLYFAISYLCKKLYLNLAATCSFRRILRASCRTSALWRGVAKL